ncbi:DUF3906 family protein [Sporolactobacillus sp. CPB3-1]|uniref:DUF3906 family protein n=1 Tax=Sporolactobacillus mangiferae TaxID=2940498 RepID=A0ABT0MDE3_9BACL|nr:DUF3906 family protein [Sporolactobacillus mangiferae]MCL1632892.1 DUF3906 family protein [Sporolactobacillus mangiferae]
MNLYRLIITTDEGEFFAVAAAENEEQAFQIADREIQHNILTKTNIRDITIVEKKIVKKAGAGYLIQPRKAYE